MFLIFAACRLLGNGLHTKSNAAVHVTLLASFIFGSNACLRSLLKRVDRTTTTTTTTTDMMKEGRTSSRLACCSEFLVAFSFRCLRRRLVVLASPSHSQTGSICFFLPSLCKPVHPPKNGMKEEVSA